MKRWKLLGKIFLAFIAIHLLGELAYKLYVNRAAASWEATVARDENGVLKDCDAYFLDPGEEAANGAAVLMVHGINASPRHYDLVAPALAELGFACRVMRLPGFAEPLEKYAGTTAADWTGAVAEELERLREEHERVVLVAHSLGGAVSIAVLLDDPKAADHAVLLAPAVAVSNARSPLLPTRAWHEIGKRTLPFTTLLQSPFGMDCRDPNRDDHPGRVPFTPRSVVDELFVLMDANRPRAAEFTTPVTMILSTDDRVIDSAAAERFFDAIGSQEKRLVELSGSGHALPLDLEWRDVVEQIDQAGWVADETAAGAGD